ncbi:MAG: efflux RND transporter permease subunit [Steroidobacterales bacterium]
MSGFNASAWALTHKSLVGFLMAIALAAGLIAYTELGRDEDPPFTIKTMIVQANWPGATADEVSRQVTDRIEKTLESLQYIDFTSSYAKPGQTVVMVNLKDTTPAGAVPGQWYQVRKKIEDMKYQLPDGVQGPFFNDEFGDVYGVIYAFTTDGFTYRELRDYVEFVRAELLRTPDVGKVDLIGVQNEVIYVDFSRRQVAGLGVDPDMIAATLRSQNAVLASGVVETPNERIAVRVSGQFDTVENIRNISVRANDRMLRIGDIATVTRGYEDPPTTLYRYQGEPAIGLGISMSPGGNILELGEGIHAAMERIGKDLPAGIESHLVANQPHVVEESVGEFTKSLFEAIVIVLIVSFLSLGLRAGLVVAICIPLVLALTFLVMQWLKIDLQRISLGALVISLGLLVDDAMIAVEMMVLKLEEGWDRFRAATFAYTSTAFPMLTGTIVTIIGFVPVGFAKSSAGEYCFTLFAVIGIALTASWIVAVIFTPYVGNAVLKEMKGHGGHVENRLARWFRPVLKQALARRKLVLIGSAAAFVVAVVLFGFVQQQFFPASDRPELLVDLRLPQNASIEATAAQVKRFEKVLLADPDIVSHTFYVGAGSVRFILAFNQELANANFAQAVIVTKGYHVRDAVKKRLENALDDDFDLLAARVQPLQLGPPVAWPIQYRVSGPDIPKIKAIANEVAALVRAQPTMSVVAFDWIEMAKSVFIDVNQDKARMLGISSSQVATALNEVLTGRTITQVRDDIYLVDLRGRADAKDRGDLRSVRELELRIGTNTVPLEQIAMLRYEFEDPIVWRRYRLPTLTVQGDLKQGIQAATVDKDLEPGIDKIRAQLPPGYKIEVGGTAAESAKGSSSITAVVPMMLLGMLIVIMIQLQSVQKLVIVTLTAPLGIIGVSLALLVSFRPFGFVAMLGVFALVGMIIRNSIVLIMQIRDNEKAGMPRYEAIVEATMHRMRPILLTAAAAILGLIPIAETVFWGPMAFAMMGGLLVATILTLIFLPALYAAWYRIEAPPVATPDGGAKIP